MFNARPGLAGGLMILLSCGLLRAEPRPHIVLILADDLGYGDVGCYHREGKIPTPQLDRLAASGMRFTDAHAGGSVCVPSRYALLCGRFPTRATLKVHERPAIDAQRWTLPRLLHSAGYRTRMVGKWHLGFEKPAAESGRPDFDYDAPLRGGPMDRGFDHFFGMHASLDIPPYFYIRGRRPVTPPTGEVSARTSLGGPEGWNEIQGAFWRAGPIADDFDHAQVTPRFASEAVAAIDAHVAEGSDQPLFLYVALPSPHTPWLPTPEFRGRSGVGMYGDFVMQVDAVVGQILQHLDDSPLGDDSLVIFSSDNGPVWYDKDRLRFGHDACGGLRGKKATSWEAGHRVPFLVRWAGHVAPATTSSQTVHFADVMATLSAALELEPLPPQAAEDSVSFLPSLLGSPQEPRPFVVHDNRTIREGAWKLLLPKGRRGRNAATQRELFDLSRDPAERHNRIEQQPKIAQRLQHMLETHLAEVASEPDR